MNDGIPEREYLGEEIDLKFSSVDDFARFVCEKGQGAAMFKLDLKVAYRQINVFRGDVRKLGYKWLNCIYCNKSVVWGQVLTYDIIMNLDLWEVFIQQNNKYFTE